MGILYICINENFDSPIEAGCRVRTYSPFTYYCLPAFDFRAQNSRLRSACGVLPGNHPQLTSCGCSREVTQIREA